MPSKQCVIQYDTDDLIERPEYLLQQLSLRLYSKRLQLLRSHLGKTITLPIGRGIQTMKIVDFDGKDYTCEGAKKVRKVSVSLVLKTLEGDEKSD